MLALPQDRRGDGGGGQADRERLDESERGVYQRVIVQLLESLGLLRRLVDLLLAGAGRPGPVDHAGGEPVAILWYNGPAIDSGPSRNAGSRFEATIAGATADHFLRNGFALDTTAGPSWLFIDVFVNRNVGGNPFKPFGTWSKTF